MIFWKSEMSYLAKDFFYVITTDRLIWHLYI